MTKYLVTFGFNVEAGDTKTARIKAKKNLKKEQDRQCVDDYSCKVIRGD